MATITENEIEQIALGYLKTLGYLYVYGPAISPDELNPQPERQYNEVVLVQRLRTAIEKLNPNLPPDAQEDAIKKVLRTDSPDALLNNETFHRYVTEGIDVEVRTAEGLRGTKVYLVDFQEPTNNEFLAINQFTIIEGNQNKRPDIILFVNGLPLVVIELKNAVIEKADLQAAYNQIKTYQQAIPSLYIYNAFNIISDGSDAAYGTVSSSFKYFKPWKTKDGLTLESTTDLQLEILLKGLCNPYTLLDAIRSFIVYEKTEKETVKKIAQYHQYYAVNKAIESTIRATGLLPSLEGAGVGKTSFHSRRKIIPYNPALKERARQLRQNMTVGEVALWNEIKRKNLGFDFDRQRPIGEFIVDFYCKDLMLAIEIDGESHSSDKAKQYDAKRQKELESLGVSFLRFDDLKVRNEVEKVVEEIRKYIAQHKNNLVGRDKPTPNPSQEGKNTGDRKAGVVWHTQGSGKSLSMVFYSGKIIASAAMQNPTLIVLTDRNDLDEQLYETFSNCQQLLRQQPRQAENRRHLKELLRVASGGIVFTTIQKFLPEFDTDIEAPAVNEPKVQYIGAKALALSERQNIVVIADEAHRSQYGFLDGFARRMRESLPNASFIGFTGTPVESTDRNTKATFGEYVDIYDIQQAVEDGATVPIYYESRVAKINFEEQKKLELDAAFDELTESEELSNQQKLKAKWSGMEAVIGSKARLDKIAEDLVNHFEKRTAVLEGKGMIVCMSRRICVELYNSISKLRPQWHHADDDKGVIKVIMTGSSSDVTDFQPHVRNKERRKAIGDRLKKPSDSLKLVIVRDMWLTGFDAPCLHTLYVDKPMQGHNLMQAIARVNRVFVEGKEGGLVVDYLGIAQYLKQAMIEYTASGGKGSPSLDDELAVAKMLEFYEAVLYQLKYFDWKKFFTLTSENKLRYIKTITDYIQSQESGSEAFSDSVSKLIKAYALVSTHEKADAIKDDVALFQALRTRLLKFTEVERMAQGGKTNEEIEWAIKQIVSSAIVSDAVIDVFDAAGIKKPDISILDDKFLEEIKGMEHKNLAVELLKKLLKDEIRRKSKFSLVQSKLFSEKLEEAIQRYHNGQIDNIEFIEKVLIPFAREMRDADKRGEALGLDFRETAFYDALYINDSAVKVLGDDILKHIAQELLKTVRSSVSIDWTIKESVQSALRRNIRRILRLHGYPPDLQERAVETVLSQAKLLANELLDRGNSTV